MKRLPPYLFFLLLALVPLRAGAQYINAYIDAGAITSQIEGDELKGFKMWNFTGGVGAFVRFDQYGTWGLSIEADYAGRGVYQNLHNSKNLYNIDLRMHYVDIPVTVFFKDPYGGIRIGLGPVYSRLVQQPHGEIEYSPNHFLPDTSDMNFLKNDFSAAAEIRFTIWNNLYMSIRYQQSLFPVKKNWHFTENDNTWANDCFNQSLSFRLLWQFGEPDRPSRRQAQTRRPNNHNRPNVHVRRNKR